MVICMIGYSVPSNTLDEYVRLAKSTYMERMKWPLKVNHAFFLGKIHMIIDTYRFG